MESVDEKSLKRRLAALAVLLILCFWALPAAAQSKATTSHALAMTGVPKYSENFLHFDYVNPKAPQGGVLKMASIGTFDSFNPFITKGVAAAGSALIYDTLTTQSLDEPFTQYGLSAERIELPADRSWVIYHLHPQARFHDGRPVTAEDVVFSFNLLITKGDPQYRKYWADVKSVEALDKTRVKFLLGDKTNRELALIIGQLHVLPKHFWESRDFANPGLEIPLGSGPYRIKEFRPGHSITYERVKDYWAAGLPVNVGQNNFDYIRYDYYRDATVALHAFKSGEYDLRQENISKAWATAYTGPAFDRGLIVKEEIPNDVDQGMQGFVFNTRRAFFQDRRVREALALAFDFEWTNKNLFYGQYTRSNSFFSNSELASRGKPSPDELALLEPYRDQLPPELFKQAFTPPATDGSGNIRRNLRRAMTLLKQAGWVVKNEKLVHAQSGREFTFEMLLHDPSFERVVLPLKKNLTRLGITMNVRVVDTSQYINRLTSYDFDMVVFSYAQSESPGNEQRYFWHSDSADLRGARNFAGIRNPVVDAMVDKVISAADRKELVVRTRALDRVLLWNWYVIPHWHTNVFRVAYWNKLSRPRITPKYSLGLFTWWVDPDKARELEKKRGKHGGS